MAITKAQQARQLYKNGGSMEDIGFSIAKPSKNGSRPGYRRSNYDSSGGGTKGQGFEGGRAPERGDADGPNRQQKAPKRKPKKTKKNTAPGLNAFERFRSAGLKNLFDQKSGNKKPGIGFSNLLNYANPSLDFYESTSDTDIMDTGYGLSGKNLTDMDRLADAINLGEKTGNLNQRQFEEAFYGPEGNKFIPNEIGGGGNIYIPPVIEEKKEEEEDVPIAYRFMADGGRAAFQEGGIMRRAALAEGGMPYEGGIMDLESGRQQYFLGKLVKKAARAVKKVAKSPFGKVALLGLGAGMAGFGPAAGLFGGGKGLAFKQMLLGGKTLPPSMGFKSKGLLGGAIDYAKSNPLKTIAAASGLAGLLTSQEEEDEGLDRGEGIDIEAIRNSPYRYLAPRFMADGGRIGYAEGSKEPVAKETMPLLDMNNQEMDLRAEGGFVPIGRMEKADDVPARLSKNEFVFTADAVRNAGNGSVDKGAEVMYNTMKNLENGGKISKKSQGLEGIL